ncbi:sigma-70 family RNA polymerase sigma factor [Roseisolibacter sp. H3M3-2]|uniref:RNA polymerase sigma factor n=1 Tax=Roseisolibacter sp. H3M3-2 TaxID=3031323 RepID=UPI0023DAB852|nr:sigma-70 family RNA polymerase sigma factor [Roseisolibacter sp. H3M3-2]MDF1505564.1 sigma-70 family RNA polymerase sigma factor [Roseisolibacter sp. H3M3-2]
MSAALVEHLFRQESGRLVAALARRLGGAHVGLAEDIVQDALLQALRTWPFRGVPDDPAAWLFRVAHRRALDVARRDATLRRKLALLDAWTDAPRHDPAAAASRDEVADDELALVFACCHPAVPAEAGVALALKTVGGFGVGEIARMFLVPEATVAQRLVRAKRRLREARVPVAVPAGAAELAARRPAVLATCYLLFTEGYAAGEGPALVRPDLCAEAVRLAGLVAAHPATRSPESHALAALLCLQAARLPARADAAGEVVLLADQDRSRWDRALLARGFGHLERAIGGDALTRYHLEARIAALHATAPSVAATDWAQVVDAYDALLEAAPSPVTRVHRAVAVGMAEGPAAALRALDAIDDAAVPARYPWYHVARAHWLRAAGDAAGAREAYARALALTGAEPARVFLAGRMAELAD